MKHSKNKRLQKIFFILANLLSTQVFAQADFNTQTVDNSNFLSVLNLFILILCLITLFVSCFLMLRTRKVSVKDELTGLNTTLKFKQEVKKVLAKARPGEWSIVSLNINSFHYITESFGQDAGNAIIVELGRHFEKTAPSDTIMCRNFTDDFFFFLHATLLPIIEDIVLTLTDVKDDVSHLLPEHFTIEFSAGAYEIQDPFENIETMMEKANSARKAGKNSINPRRIALFTEKMANTIEQEKSILFDMERAYENNEFEVYYQPKFNFSDSKIMGAEALVRWNHKSKGLLQPGAFVPLFERNGFIQKIDIMVFESVCKFLDEWNKKTSDTPYPITISCNLSRVQLYNPDVAKTYKEIASKYQIAPSAIEIELTESLMMDNKDRLLKAMNEIKKAGFSISVDDFGSGFSSLSLLKDIPANVIKLDKEFLNTDFENEKEHIIINSVIDMAKNLDMTTVAEGVEDQHQSELLKEMGCDIVQGFFYAKPMPESEFSKLLARAVS